MKTQKILLIVLIVLVVAVIAIQLFVKQKVVLNGGATGTSGVFNKNIEYPAEVTEVEPSIILE